MTDGWLSLKIQLNLLSFLWKGPPIFRGFHCLWLLLDSFFLPLTFLPHKILSPNLHLFYKIFRSWVVKVASLWKKIPLLLLCCSRRRDLFQFVLLECHSILVVYIASSEELLHTLLKCVSKSKGKLQRKGEREREESLISCLLCWYQYATLEISNFSPGGHHQVGLSIREKAPYYLCFSGHINFKKKKS